MQVAEKFMQSFAVSGEQARIIEDRLMIISEAIRDKKRPESFTLTLDLGDNTYFHLDGSYAFERNDGMIWNVLKMDDCRLVDIDEYIDLMIIQKQSETMEVTPHTN